MQPKMDYRNYILCGLIVFGMIVTAFSKPASNDRGTAEGGIQNDGETQNDDYDYEDGSQSSDQSKSTTSNPKSTMAPYFDSKVIRRTVKPGGNLTLECPVKNSTETNVVLWYKEDNPITNNNNVLNNAYELSKQNFSLIIKNATESFAGNYYCVIAPQKVRLQTILKVSNEPEPAVPTPPELPQIKEAATATESTGSTATDPWTQSSLLPLILVSILMSKLLSHRKCFQSLLTV